MHVCALSCHVMWDRLYEAVKSSKRIKQGRLLYADWRMGAVSLRVVRRPTFMLRRLPESSTRLLTGTVAPARLQSWLPS